MTRIVPPMPNTPLPDTQFNLITREAELKSWKLLIHHLNDDQVNSIVELNRIDGIKGCYTGRIYNIRIDVFSFNIATIDINTSTITRYCLTSCSNIPIWDTILSQYLLLKSDEKSFLEKANFACYTALNAGHDYNYISSQEYTFYKNVYFTTRRYSFFL